MEDIQDNVKALSAERDRFKTLFKQVSFRNSQTNSQTSRKQLTSHFCGTNVFCLLRLKRT